MCRSAAVHNRYNIWSEHTTTNIIFTSNPPLITSVLHCKFLQELQYKVKRL